MLNQNNPLLCDPETGFCELPGESTTGTIQAETNISMKLVKVVYFTDPICSSCWGAEPSWRKLKAEWGHILDIEYRMGGLLPDWSYNSGGISQPSDVAHHWDEVSGRYEMPIDGDVWLEDPLDSSYPPSIAFKAAQLQDEQKAILFLREIREMVFLEKKNIAKTEHLTDAAKRVGLDTGQFRQDLEGKARELFYQDLAVAKEYGVRGFPTFFFLGAAGNMEKVYGARPYDVFEDAVRKLCPEAAKTTYSTDWQHLFDMYASLTAKEYAGLADVSIQEAEAMLDKLFDQRKLTKKTTKNGALWTLQQNT